MIKKHLTSLLFFSMLFTWSCNPELSTKIKSMEESGSYRFAFYNVENLFDTVDDPKVIDEEFLPEGKKKWTEERYQKKLDDLAKVMNAMDYPSIIGLCEVENKKVLEDFVKKTSLSKYKYGIVHHDSPDVRGIDVGFLYLPKVFKVISSDVTRINFPKEIVEDYTTRDILHVEGIFKGKEKLHFFINHWPSRRGGLEASEPKRMYVAEQLKKRVNELFEKEPSAKIIIMGDMNDEPDNNSLTKGLRAYQTGQYSEASSLYNCSIPLKLDKQGTYNYRGNWNLLDQIIVSGELVGAKAKLKVGKMHILKEDWMLYKNEKYGATPSRTYGGPNYYGGYSDHLPVYIEVNVKQ